MKMVVDSSILLAWVLDEGSVEADAVVGLLDRATGLVPSVWPLEFANALVMAERRQRISAAEAFRAREIVMCLDLRVVPDHPPRIMSEITMLARTHRLSVYAASYLDLALREGVPLASLDAELVAAAEKCGVARVQV